MWSIPLGFVVLLTSGCTLFFADETTEDNPSNHDASSPSDASDGTVSTWGEPNYAHRLPFSVASPVSEDLNDFPVLLTLGTSELGGRILADSSKIKLVHNGTTVPVQLEMGPLADEQVSLWFQADLIQGEKKDYFLYFDSAEGELGDSSSLWDAYTTRWNFSDNTEIQFLDTAGNNHANIIGTGNITKGRVGMGVKAKLSAPGQVAVAPNPIVGEYQCMSVSGWVNSLSVPVVGVRNSIVHTSGESGELGTYQLNYVGNTISPSALISYDSFIQNIPEQMPDDGITPKTWTWLAFNVVGGSAQFFKDGFSVGAPFSMTTESPTLIDGSLHIGGQLNGTIDELRLSTKCHSNAWMRAEYLSVESPLPELGTVESRPE